MGKHDFDYLIAIPGVCNITDKAAYTNARQALRCDAEVTNPKEKFFQVIKQLIESVFTDGIRSIPSFNVAPDGVMSGTFKEKQARGQLYTFIISKEGKIQYNEIKPNQRNDSLTFPYWTFRADKRSQPQCSKGKRCKGSCIEKGRVCNVELNSRIKAKLPEIQKIALDIKQQNFLLKTSVSEKTQLDIQLILEEEEAKIKDLPYETAVILDSKSGEILLTKKGQKTSIGFTTEEINKAKGAILTHNHPDLDYPPDSLAWEGAPFSVADIMCASINELNEIRAVGHIYRYSLKPPKEGWNKEFFQKQIVPAFNKNAIKEYQGLVQDIQEGKRDANSASLEYQHRTMQATAKDLKMSYKRSVIPNVDKEKLKKEYHKRMRTKKIKKVTITGVLIGAAIWAESVAQKQANQPQQKQQPIQSNNNKLNNNQKLVNSINSVFYGQ